MLETLKGAGKKGKLLNTWAIASEWLIVLPLYAERTKRLCAAHVLISQDVTFPPFLGLYHSRAGCAEAQPWHHRLDLAGNVEIVLFTHVVLFVLLDTER